jgi:hypothetical protein
MTGDETRETGDETREPLKDLEENPPEKLEDWPDDERKYETFGGREGDHSYAEGPEKNLGPSDLRHHEDGSVTIKGEEVDNPDEFKGDPIPGGPTDPGSPSLEGDRTEEEGEGAS